MTPKEQLKTILEGGVADTVPFFPVLRFWWAQQEEKGALQERWRGEEGLVRLHAEIPAGIYWPPENEWRTEYGQCAERRHSKGSERLTEYETPKGTLCRREQFLPESQCWAPVAWPVRSLDDLRILRYLAADRRFAPDHDAFSLVTKTWGDQGLPLLLPPVRSPICALVYEWTGVEALSYLSFDYPREVEAAIDVLRKADDTVFEDICRWPDAPLVEFNDNLSSEVMTGFVRQFGTDNYVQRVQQLHAAGKFVSVHIDGTLRGLLEIFARLGFDCAEGITPLPSGDVAIEGLRVLSGPDIRLWGGLPGAIFSRSFPEKDFQNAVVHAVRVCRRDPRFILGIGDILPPDGVMERVKWVSDAIRQDGKNLDS